MEYPQPSKIKQQGPGHTLTRGDSPLPNPPEFHTKNPLPPNRKREKGKGEKFANSLRNPRRWEKNGQKINFPLRFSNVKRKTFSKISYLNDFSENAQNFAASFLNLF